MRRLILTTSGGPFWNKRRELTRVTVSDALAHPTWKMEKKISVDSATMMNKAFEIIERDGSSSPKRSTLSSSQSSSFDGRSLTVR